MNAAPRIEVVEAELSLRHGDLVVDVTDVDGHLRVDLHRWRDLKFLWSERQRGKGLVSLLRRLGIAGTVRCKGVPVHSWS